MNICNTVIIYCIFIVFSSVLIPFAQDELVSAVTLIFPNNIAYAEIVQARFVEAYTRDEKQYPIGKEVPFGATFFASGEDKDIIYIGYSLQDPNRKWLDLPYTYTKIGRHPNEIKGAGFKWVVPPNASEGWYNVKFTLWKGVFTTTEPDTMLGRLAVLEVPNAFEVKHDFELNADIRSIEFQKNQLTHGETVVAEAIVVRDAKRYFLSLSVRDEYGNLLDIPYKTIGSSTFGYGVMQEEKIRMEWQVPPSASLGWYQARMTTWAAIDTTTDPPLLAGKIDTVDVYDAFKVISISKNPSIFLKDDLIIYDNVETSLLVTENTSESKISTTQETNEKNETILDHTMIYYVLFAIVGITLVIVFFKKDYFFRNGFN